ncbi:MAG TPA: glycine cleavage system protein GcvH [Burkholderiaceae bacterium]|jgi:glycine cleavage system H protein|nr:glycine cleavage system protein GcvH [Burkholderiaceae bacterium]
MQFPEQLKYTSTHEWVKQGEDGLIWVGITDAAQDMLGDLVFVGDVKVGQTLKAGETAGVVESVKAASDIYAPVDGEVVAFNDALEAEPQKLNSGPYDAWIFKMKSAKPMDGLLSAEKYRANVDAAK